MSETGASEGFWDFSVRTYRTDGVADACLSLQNDYAADVNMLLYCCWLGACQGKFDQALFDRSNGFSSRWADEVVKPLRSARTWMKHAGCQAESMPTEACMNLREDIKSVEFAAEKMQQHVLESLVPAEVRRGSVSATTLNEVAANLLRYSEHAGVKDCDDVRQKLAVVIQAAFPDQQEQAILQALNRP